VCGFSIILKCQRGHGKQGRIHARHPRRNAVQNAHEGSELKLVSKDTLVIHSFLEHVKKATVCAVLQHQHLWKTCTWHGEVKR
jgi:hypothetical protein